MTFDSLKHHRRSIRLHDYDYAQAGAYFVTIVAKNHACLFGELIGSAMRLNQFGVIVQSCWEDLPVHYPNVELDAFVVMPNHLHGIVVITDGTVGARHASPLPHASPLQLPHGTAPGSLGTMIGSFKSAAAKRVNKSRDTPGAPVWQRNYYEHIIRDEKDLERIREYIDANSFNWTQDEENPETHKSSSP